LLGGHDGQWSAVEELFDTREFEPVYNLRVAEYHTYFVGSRGWGFSVWAHNAVCTPEELANRLNESAVDESLPSDTRRTGAKTTLDLVRNKGPLEGFMLETMVQENQVVHAEVQRLLREFGPEILISQERGGTLMTEVAVGGAPELANRQLLIE